MFAINEITFLLIPQTAGITERCKLSSLALRKQNTNVLKENVIRLSSNKTGQFIPVSSSVYRKSTFDVSI